MLKTIRVRTLELGLWFRHGDFQRDAIRGEATGRRERLTDFQPGEVFRFGVETDDDGGGWTTGADFAGASLEATSTSRT